MCPFTEQPLLPSITAMKKQLLVLLLGVVLTACASEPPRPGSIQLDYSSLGKIYLNTQDIKVADRTNALKKPPNIGHLFRPTLAEAVNQWTSDRLQAVGKDGHATLVIKEASVVEKPLPITKGVDSWFNRQQAAKYLARLEVEISAQTPVNHTNGFASAHATHAVTLPENPTEAEKLDAYRILLDGLMVELNQNLEKAMRQHMAPFITDQVPSGNYAPAGSDTMLPPTIR